MKTLYIPLALLFLSCQPSYNISKFDRKLLRENPEIVLVHSGMVDLVRARRIEIIDSLRQEHQLDIELDNYEEQHLED